MYPINFFERDFNEVRFPDNPPSAAIRAEQIKGRAKSFNKLMNKSPKNLMYPKTSGVTIPKITAATTLKRIRYLLYREKNRIKIFP